MITGLLAHMSGADYAVVGAGFALMLLLLLPIAFISYHLFERPFLRLRRDKRT